MKRLLKVAELADYIGSTKQSIYTQLNTGKIPPEWIVRHGRSVRFDKEEVDQWINRCKKSSSPRGTRIYID